jgi:hypothetical protein
MKMVDTAVEGCEGPGAKIISALVPEADSDAQAPDDTPTVASNGRSKKSRKNHKKHDKRNMVSLLHLSIELDYVFSRFSENLYRIKILLLPL